MSSSSCRLGLSTSMSPRMRCLSAFFASFFLAALLIASAPVTYAHAAGPAQLARPPVLDFLERRASSSSSALPTASCKAVPDTPSWPATSAWAQLNESTGGRVFQPAPPGAVCHPGQPTYNAALCPDVQSAWLTQQFHEANPVSSLWQVWNNDTCLPNATDPCSGVGYPVYVINATTAEHVKAGVDFARKYSIRLIVKSSGHDYVGRSSAPNALSIWVHHMNTTELHDTFTPQGCPCSVKYNTSITAGGGTRDIDMYKATAAVGQVALGGGGQGVSMGGYLTGGGHSILSPRYGLAADQVLEMEIVTPQGEILTLNECQNIDLFWAMRGGGGSTFGVLTAVTVKTFPSPTMVNYDFAIGTANYTNPAFFDMIAYLISQYPSLGDAGVSGYSSWTPKEAVQYDNITINVAGMAGYFVVQDTQNPSVIENLFNPIWQYVNATWPGQFELSSSGTTVFASFLDWYTVNYDTSGAGTDMYIGSRLLSRAALTSNLTAAADAYKQFGLSSGGDVFLVSGKGVFDAKPPGGGNAVCPAWRTSYVHAITGVAFPPLDPTARAESRALLDYQVEALRELDPTSGAYVNEADAFEPDFQQTFWGDNYPRLLAIKRAVDPDDVLWCTPCVGNERWQEVGDLLCRV